MSQPETELATPGEESIEDIAGAMAPEDETQDDDLPETEEIDGEVEAGDPPDDDDPEEEWEAGGKKIRVKRSELRAGYMKDADYRRKTAEVAEQRRAVEQHAQQIAQERQHAANSLDVFLGALQKELIGSQPDPKLIEEDPQEFLRQQAAYQQRASQFQAALQQRQTLQGRIDADEQRKRDEWRKGEGDKLLDRLPEWRDEKKRAAESEEIASYLNALGYTADELGELVDHRALLVARDAAKYRALQAAKDKQAKPEPHKPVRPGAASGAQPNSTLQRANERLRRNPSDLDALGALIGAGG